MAILSIGFSEGGISVPMCTIESPTVEEGLETAWQNNAVTLDNATATVHGNGTAYRYLRRAGKWQLLGSHPVPELLQEQHAE